MTPLSLAERIAVGGRLPAQPVERAGPELLGALDVAAGRTAASPGAVAFSPRDADDLIPAHDRT